MWKENGPWEETGISLQIPSDTGSDGRAAPPRSRLLRKQGEKEAQIHKAQSPAQCSWWSTSPHSCRNPKPLTPHCPLSSVLLPHGKAMLTCRYKNVSFALLLFISTPKCRSTHTLASSGYSQFYISLHKSFQLISNSKIKKFKSLLFARNVATTYTGRCPKKIKILDSFRRILPECHPITLWFALGLSLWITLVIWFPFTFHLLIQRTHYRVWMWDFTSWSLWLSVESSLFPYLRFWTGKWVSVTSAMQYFLTGSWCLAIWKQACLNIACTFPTSTDLWDGTCARTSERKTTDNRVLTL